MSALTADICRGLGILTWFIGLTVGVCLGAWVMWMLLGRDLRESSSQATQGTRDVHYDVHYGDGEDRDGA